MRRRQDRIVTRRSRLFLIVSREPSRGNVQTGHRVGHVLLQGVEKTHLRDNFFSFKNCFRLKNNNKIFQLLAIGIKSSLMEGESSALQ
jgi:hypothetical protein